MHKLKQEKKRTLPGDGEIRSVKDIQMRLTKKKSDLST